MLHPPWIDLILHLLIFLHVLYSQSAVDDEGAVGVDDEFDIYEDLQLDAIIVSAGVEEGGIAVVDGAG